MPRSSVTQDVRAQNRECQRRSRARRRELVDDLKKRVEDYERNGVSASLEMQEAARRVNIENQRLKQLLQLRGVSSEEIQQYLSSPLTSPDAMSGASYPPAIAPKCITCGMASFDSKPVPEEVKASVGYHAEQSEIHTEEPAAIPNDEQLELTVPYLGQQGPMRSHHSPEPTTPTSHKIKLETSCDAAAAILVQLHAHTDNQGARAALGCAGAGHCSVKNTEFFQLMDTIC